VTPLYRVTHMVVSKTSAAKYWDQLKRAWAMQVKVVDYGVSQACAPAACCTLHACMHVVGQPASVRSTEGRLVLPPSRR
jgi:hypothetical protein